MSDGYLVDQSVRLKRAIAEANNIIADLTDRGVRVDLEIGVNLTTRDVACKKINVETYRRITDGHV